ncbi:hypothetical protein TRIATDRAFT_300320 [Trichoderma atroviride IMI 206040]|uniref:Uncharacterized protein n=1 Tax=Hypocrea atroviridis (strain ATCC 20476 / IMI 206040) TaxID=452589 RepID=G9NZP9_HYPAI|nr:uncharacterized protein TRIATDRAFT_300320 [Trichoderma atroviride IMI 206040]EHK43948.1 hypothetical protein TRIATDRAFT_300320 [Trichoderma atroviride IMI 206040]
MYLSCSFLHYYLQKPGLSVDDSEFDLFTGIILLRKPRRKRTFPVLYMSLHSTHFSTKFIGANPSYVISSHPETPDHATTSFSKGQNSPLDS